MRLSGHPLRIESLLSNSGAISSSLENQRPPDTRQVAPWSPRQHLEGHSEVKHAKKCRRLVMRAEQKPTKSSFPDLFKRMLPTETCGTWANNVYQTSGQPAVVDDTRSFKRHARRGIALHCLLCALLAPDESWCHVTSSLERSDFCKRDGGCIQATAPHTGNAGEARFSCL